MKKIIVVFPLFFICIFSFCQNEIPEFGKPDLEELKMKDCDFEPGASALKILKFEKIELITERYWSFRIERFTRIKILKEDGYSYADIEIPYTEKKKIKNLTAYIYNVNEVNEIITEKLDGDDIFKKADKNKKNGAIVFTFPGLKKGSVIEYRYIETEEDPNYFDIKNFQDEIPIKNCIYKIDYPNQINPVLTFPLGQGKIISNIELNQPVEYRNIQTLSTKEVSSFRTEPFMSPIADNLQYATLHFNYSYKSKDSLLQTSQANNNLAWGGISLNFISEPFYSEQIKKKISGTAELVDSLRKINDPETRIERIFKRVKERITWTNEETIIPADLEKAWKIGSGSNAEINLIILNLLKRVGIECYPLMIRSREHGRANQNFYSFGQFNNINIIVFNKKDFFVLDGTQKFISYKTLPFPVLNRDALLVDTFRTKWIRIIDKRPFLKQSVSINAEVKDDGKITGTSNISYYDYSRQLEILKKQNQPINRYYKEINFLEKNNDKLDSNAVEYINEFIESLPLEEHFKFSYSPQIADYIIIDPLLFFSFRKNPFISSARLTDIDFGSNQSYNLDIKLNIPDKYIIESLSASIQLNSKDSNIVFSRSITRDNNIVEIKTSFEIRRTFYSKDDYQLIQDIFKRIYSVLNDPIVLKKK